MTPEFTAELKRVQRLDAIKPHLPAVSSLVTDELSRAVKEYEPFGSHHEGYAVILEEMDKLWDQIKFPVDQRNPNKILEQAVCVAAMGFRFAIDICMKGNVK